MKCTIFSSECENAVPQCAFKLNSAPVTVKRTGI